jgi:hypothetical protein
VLSRWVSFFSHEKLKALGARLLSLAPLAPPPVSCRAASVHGVDATPSPEQLPLRSLASCLFGSPDQDTTVAAILRLVSDAYVAVGRPLDAALLLSIADLAEKLADLVAKGMTPPASTPTIPDIVETLNASARHLPAALLAALAAACGPRRSSRTPLVPVASQDDSPGEKAFEAIGIGMYVLGCQFMASWLLQHGGSSGHRLRETIRVASVHADNYQSP